MDPHSRHSQYNHRAPKSGPQPQNNRFMDVNLQPKPSLDNPSKRPASKPSAPVIIRRPIATNSRVKQDEQFRKDMYLSFVNNALQQKTNGITEPFDELVNQFNPKSQSGESIPQLAQLRLWILALSHVVSRLERTHSALVEAIVSLPWTTLDSATGKSYTVFIGMLISARPEYLSLVLAKIAQGFTHQSGLQALDAGMPEGSSTPLTRRVIYDRLHSLLRHLLSLIPTLPSTLLPLLVRNFPHKRQNQAAQSTYIRNLLRVSGYCPELADKILATIVDRAIQIDVEIQVELEELEDDEAAQDDDLFEIDPFDTLVGQQEVDSDTDDEDDEDDNFSDISSEGGGMDDAVPVPEIPTNVKHIQEMVKKLDAILTLIFDHFHRTHTGMDASNGLQTQSLPELLPLPPISPSSSRPSSPFIFSAPSTAPIFNSTSSPSSVSPTSRTPTPPYLERSKLQLRNQFLTLLSIFDRTILRTFKSRYTQFLIFWYTSLDPEFSDIFQGMLVDRALFQGDASGAASSLSSTPAVTRAAAASYIGSFISRAAFVGREDARRVVGVLCEFLRAHLEGVEEMIRIGGVASSAGMAQNSVFYAVVQAVFLIFCFRWRDLLEEEDEGGEEMLIGSGEKGGKKWIPELKILQRVVNSILNPLKVCSPNVVMQFARVAQATHFIYCYTILESNKRSEYGSNNAEGRVNVTSTFHSAMFDGDAHAELNTFFPFDPYRLPKSNVYIQSVYREWSSVAIDDEEDDEDDDEDEDEDADEDEDNEDKGGEDRDNEDSLRNSGYLIPQSDASTAGKDEDGAGGLGESLGAMSISPMIPVFGMRSGHSP